MWPLGRIKVINRWYLTLKKLAKMYPQLRDQYSECGHEGADYYHMWWACPNVSFFGEQWGMFSPK